MDTPVRIDKWLWAIRIYKTRSLAADACKGGKIKQNGQIIKPSRIVKVDEIYTIQLEQILKTIKVTGIIEKRLSAVLAAKYFEDLTPKEEYEKPILLKNIQFVKRTKGTGRPTKKERRKLDDLSSF